MLLGHAAPGDLHLVEQEGQVAEGLQVVFPALGQSPHLVVACEWAARVDGITNFDGVSLYIHVSPGPLEINYYELTQLVQHDVLGFNVSVQVPAVVDELHDFDQVNKDILVGQS